MSPGSVAGPLLSDSQFSSRLAVTIFSFADSQTGKNFSGFWFSNHKWHQIIEAEYCLEKKELSTSRLKCFVLAESQLSQMWYLSKKEKKKQTNKSWKTFLYTIYFLSSSFMKIHEVLRGQNQRVTTSIYTVDLIASGWRGIAEWFKQTGGWRWYLFGWEQRKIIKSAVISSGFGEAIKTWLIKLWRERERQRDFSREQDEDCWCWMGTLLLCVWNILKWAWPWVIWSHSLIWRQTYLQ